MPNKRSFFEKLTGAVRLDEEPEHFEEESVRNLRSNGSERPKVFEEEHEEEAQLTIDVYQTATEICIKTMVAGVKPDDLEVLISRDSVTIKGRRSEERTIAEEDYFHQELYWGSFARTVNLPEEIDVDGAEAVEKHGMLILHLPKLDKNRQAKIKVKGG